MATRTGNKDGPLSTRPPWRRPLPLSPETLAHPAGSSQKPLKLFPVRPEGGDPAIIFCSALGGYWPIVPVASSPLPRKLFGGKRPNPAEPASFSAAGGK